MFFFFKRRRRKARKARGWVSGVCSPSRGRGVRGRRAPRRSAVLPDVPTISESGVPGYEAHNWWGILAPAGTPAPVTEKLHKDLTSVLSSQETEKRFETEGAEVVRMTPAEFGGFISAELVKWSRVAREVGIKAE